MSYIRVFSFNFFILCLLNSLHDSPSIVFYSDRVILLCDWLMTSAFLLVVFLTYPFPLNFPFNLAPAFKVEPHVLCT